MSLAEAMLGRQCGFVVCGLRRGDGRGVVEGRRCCWDFGRCCGDWQVVEVWCLSELVGAGDPRRS